MTDQTPSTERVERARFEVASRHHFHGEICLCAPDRLRARARDRTEHILDAFIKELDLDAWLAARDRETAAKALSSLSAEFTRMSLELQESDRYAEDYWRGSAQALTAAAQLAEDHATSIGAGDE